MGPAGEHRADPVPWQGTLAEDVLPIITPGDYCFRVRARADRAPGNQEVWGDYTYLSNGNVDSKDPSVPRSPGRPTRPTDPWRRPAASGFALPMRRRTTSHRSDREHNRASTPLFTWHAMSGMNSYFVVVAKDANFSNIIDEAFTRIPGVRPAEPLKPTTYSDETTTFYWLSCPRPLANGNDALTVSLSAAKGRSRSSRPRPASSRRSGCRRSSTSRPSAGRRRSARAATGCRSPLTPPSAAPLDDVVTDATSYSSDTTYPADTVLYWRVRADDENLTGLTWSATGTFQKKLATPVPSAANATSGDALPVWAWSPVQGAASYDISVDKPDGTHSRLFEGFRTPVASFIKMTGTGVFHWRVRAEFPKDTTGTVPGPYSATQSFTRTIGEPVNASTDSDEDARSAQLGSAPGRRPLQAADLLDARLQPRGRVGRRPRTRAMRRR